MGMTAHEVGTYIRLLCYQWGTGKLSSDPATQEIIAGGKVSEAVLAKFPRGKNRRLEQERRKQQEYRKKQRNNGMLGGRPAKPKPNPSLSSGLTQTEPNYEPKKSSPSPSPSPNKDKRASMKNGDGKFKSPTLEEVKLCCAKTGLPESDAEWFWNKCEGNGWTNGGKPIKRWPNVIASWKAAGYLPSQKQGTHRTIGGKTEQEILADAIM